MQSRDYVFKEVDGVKVEATAFWMPRGSAAPYGIALGFHGGAFVVGSRHFIPRPEIEHLADAGFVVVSADYRLCPQVSLLEIIQDATDVFEWCKSELPGKLKADGGIDVDPTKTVAFGQSAGGFLALTLGGLPNPPAAILDFYGMKYTTDPFWRTPLPALVDLPSVSPDFLDKIHAEPVQTTTMTSLEKAAAAPKDAPRRRGMPTPNLSVPRSAWLYTALKEGTHLGLIHRGTGEDVDPARLFTRRFPPTFFLHGDADGLVPEEFSVRAYKGLKGMGAVTELEVVPGATHGFDAGIATEDEDWPPVRRGLDFLVRQAGL
ncbi:Alpha/Beta hydrolase protein [Staphylotrichum tortipilum]|uniref:Alpha/Beta hydrolase protein n=1 Tax=Staphylotrichum tortipilum TaxID=2831512 RepID=A0AAN6RRQ5_9PEZI|nr:Alpha/Beta hydrolase protein [Staphylotrichum longicolle]